MVGNGGDGGLIEVGRKENNNKKEGRILNYIYILFHWKDGVDSPHIHLRSFIYIKFKQFMFYCFHIFLFLIFSL